MVEKDVVEKQFMVTGDLTRELYSEECTFKDEIDTYALDKWCVIRLDTVPILSCLHCLYVL